MTDTPATRIQRLSDALANKIAAGEVVERPASVLKELVENALDAQAGRIDVKAEGGGRELVEVRDDGVGMGPEDALLCLERHATSKLRSDADLFAIRTLGFRGEALPSIAAVSRFSLLTRTGATLEGTRVVVEGGRLVEQAAAGAPAGTVVRVADLFFNVPARRKFLRRPATELQHLSEGLVRLALSHPEVGFSLEHDGRVMFSSPAGDDPRERIAAALGRDVHPHLYPVQGEADGVRVSGWTAAPSVTRTHARGIYTFVNRRFVRDRQVAHAITHAYGDLVDRGRSPVVVLFLEVPPEEVDVNVHPQKHEVRFRDGRAVHHAVGLALRRTLSAAPWAGGRPRPYTVAGLAGDDPAAERRQRVVEALARWGETARARPADARPDLFARPAGAGPWQPAGEATASTVLREAEAPGRERGYFGRLTFLAQLKASYLLCEGPDGLVVIDQHAAHERLEFERLRAAWARREVPVQRLLVPRTLELSLGDAGALAAHADALAGFGFDLSPLGGGTVAVHAVPGVLREKQLEAVLRELAADLSELEAGFAFERAVDRLLATVACHSVVRAGERLDRQACEALLARMDPIPFKANCPHGRPVAFELELAELERRFGRR